MRLNCSSYSSTALEFERKHKLDPVFDSPRMSRRSLHLSAAACSTPEDAHSESVFGSGSSRTGKKGFAEQASKMTKQRKSVMKPPGSVRRTPRKIAPSSSMFSHSSFSSHASDGSFMSTILDESSIQEQTAVDHFWGLDDDGDLKGGDTTVIQANGSIVVGENQTALSNGYTCSDCSMLSERKEVLTAYSAPRLPSSRVYSRDRSQKHKSRGLSFYTNKIQRAAKYTATSFTSLIVQLFQMILLKLGYDCKGHSNYCGSMNVKEYLREDGHLGINGESLCDDCKGKKHLETYTAAHMQSSRSKRVARTMWHIFSYAGYFLLHLLQRLGATGRFVSRKVVSLLWLAVMSPGKAAAGVFWWLGTGWYQLVTLISLLNVFLLTRCLPKMFRLLLFLLPLLLLLGLWHWSREGFLSLLPVLNWTSLHRTHRWEDSAKDLEPRPDSFSADRYSEDSVKFFGTSRMDDLEKQVAFMSERWHHRDEEFSKMLFLLHNLQDKVTQMSDRSEMLVLIKNVVGQHLKEMKAEEAAHPAHEYLAGHQEHEWRIVALEDLLAKLSKNSEGFQRELELTKAKIVSDTDEQTKHLISKIKQLELELAHMKSELLNSQGVRTCCDDMGSLHEKVDAQVKESIRFLLFGNQQGDLPEPLLQWLMSKFVSKSDFHVLLRDLELRILRNITLQMSVTNTKSVSEVVTSVVNEAGIAGISEAQARLIVNNALKLYSQDKTGMVDFALESGGGSILSTRCSETYETKTALISLFGIPLWYFSQSPRVVIQPDMYPGNCWAFKGSQGYLVVRLSMMIYPTAFTLEHIPKSLSPTGNITSAPKDFTVYGLENEYQEEGELLGQYTYDQDGESLQMFQVMETTEKAFQIMELRIFSNWGHTEYTCLYRFRVHGRPAE
ncbi:SUN domain-containing protein 1 isoform X2 [Varanus komodoensis]|uniref:SUN domain-containing protein 1 isoform X2 n=1 Tax=Varanus komodoensis TaxID=61221 RepID=UPI001CF7A582|nr:SUN domain-containing protein 1 isoform X2 [Varanus komodoensis]